MNYISMLDETNKYAKILDNLSKGDTLLLLYPAGKDQISLSVVNQIKNSKGTIIFDEIKPLKSLNSEVAIAYRLGGLEAKYGTLQAISDNPLLLEIIGKPQAKKRASSSTATTSNPVDKTTEVNGEKQRVVVKKKTAKTKSSDITPLPEEGYIEHNEPGVESISELKDNSSLPKRIRKRKPKEGTFEYEFSRFEALCDSLKTKKFNPKDYISSISSAVKSSKENDTSFEDSINLVCSSNIASQIITAFKDKKDELYDIVTKMHALDN